MKKQYNISGRDSFDPPDKKYRIHKEDKGTVKKYQNKEKGAQTRAVPHYHNCGGAAVSIGYYTRFFRIWSTSGELKNG